jgi:hypothetical protein
MEERITAQRDAKVNDADRLALAQLLIKFGYTVRIGKERKDGKTTNQYYVAFSKQE